MKSSGLTLLFCLSLLAGCGPKENPDPNVFHSSDHSFTLKKPSDWFFDSSRRSDTLVLVTRYREPHDGLNPSLSVAVRNDDQDPEEALRVYLKGLQSKQSSLKVVSDVHSAELGGHPAANAVVTWQISIGGKSTQVKRTSWMAKSGKAYLIFTDCAQDEADDLSGSFQTMLDSIKIK